jgi:FMN phosphatase YigB (HAD superfamily)
MVAQQKIRNIIFDLGGVILNIDYKKTEDAFIALGIQNFASLYSQFHASNLFKDFETGKVSPTDFIRELRKHAPAGVSDQQMVNAWNAMLLDFPAGRLTFLHQLKKTYKTFLLSNTNILHYNAIQQNYQEVMQAEVPLDRCFNRSYYSHDIGVRKPGKEVYEFVLRENKLDEKETLFIDDTPANVEGAKEAGLEALYLKSPLKVEDLFVNGKLIQTVI